MRKILLLAVACLFVSGLKAGNTKGLLFNNYLSIVPELGVTCASLTSVASNSEFGFYGGVGLRVGKRKHLYTGAYYQALRVTMSENKLMDPALVKSNYLTVPVMFGYSLIDEKLLKVRAYGGALYYRFLSAVVPEDMSARQFQENLLGARVGVGLNIWRIEANASYDMSVAKMFSAGSEARPHGYNLSLGFRF